MTGRSVASARVIVVSFGVVMCFGWIGPGTRSVSAQNSSQASDPCTATLAEGTPVPQEGLQGESIFSPSSPEQAGEVGNPADYPFDLVFIDAMSLHHQSAIVMAEIALIHADREEVRELASAIISGQQAEIDQLRVWRDAWYPGADPTPANVLTGLSDEGMMRSGAMSGMGQGTAAMDMSQAVAGLCRADGPFDLAFIEAMIPHHQGAVGMALLALERAQHEELKTLAEGIVAAQQEEITQIMAWSVEWYPTAVGTPAT